MYILTKAEIQKKFDFSLAVSQIKNAFVFFLVPIIILGDVFFGFTSASIGPIAHFAHLGGAITGFLMMWYWKKNQFNNKRWN